jgi:hypothetical protein
VIEGEAEKEEVRGEGWENRERTDLVGLRRLRRTL